MAHEKIMCQNWPGDAAEEARLHNKRLWNSWKPTGARLKKKKKKNGIQRCDATSALSQHGGKREKLLKQKECERNEWKNSVLWMLLSKAVVLKPFRPETPVYRPHLNDNGNFHSPQFIFMIIIFRPFVDIPYVAYLLSSRRVAMKIWGHLSWLVQWVCGHDFVLHV